MFVVPVHGDKVQTKDDSTPRTVSSFSSLKDEPAVYLKPGTSQDRYIYFSDIVVINGVRVEYDSTSKTFNALGPLERKYNIPQPKDIITVKLIETAFKEEKQDIVVKSIKLHNKREGIARGLLACGDKSCFSFDQLINIERASQHGTEEFSADRFKKYYRDYLPFNMTSKGSK